MWGNEKNTNTDVKWYFPMAKIFTYQKYFLNVKGNLK